MNIKTCRHCDIRFNRADEAPIPHDRCERCHEEIEVLGGMVEGNKKWRWRSATHEDTSARNKYEREIKPGVWVDVYDVLKAFDVRNGALQHLIKKALAPGQRGHKELMEDLDDIIASAKRAKELEQ